jgi:putative membrane protein
MQRTLVMAAVAALLVLSRGTAAQDASETITDGQFVAKASSSGSTEVEAAKLALRSSQTNEVKAFAQRMITDHTRANQQLLALAGKKQIPVPKTIDAKCQQALDRLSRLQGSEFDKAYSEQMVKDHKEAVALFDAESRQSKDAELKGFASQTLPTLKEHLKMAQELNGEKDQGSKNSDKR